VYGVFATQCRRRFDSKLPPSIGLCHEL
jgi:hypothetical protein